MGSCLSTDKTLRTTRGGIDLTNSTGAYGGPLSINSVQKRIESIPETKTATFGGLKVRYAYISQRGYYPDGNETLYISFRAFYSFIFFAHPPRLVPYCTIRPQQGQSGCLLCRTQLLPINRQMPFSPSLMATVVMATSVLSLLEINFPFLASKYISRTRTKEEKLLKVRSNGTAEDSPPFELNKMQIQSNLEKAHVECNRNMHRSHTLDDSLSRNNFHFGLSTWTTQSYYRLQCW